MPVAASAIYFLNLRGDVLINRLYRDDVGYTFSLPLSGFLFCVLSSLYLYLSLSQIFCGCISCSMFLDLLLSLQSMFGRILQIKNLELDEFFFPNRLDFPLETSNNKIIMRKIPQVYGSSSRNSAID